MRKTFHRRWLFGAFIAAVTTLIGCGGGGGGNSTDPTISQALGTWEGTMTVTGTRAASSSHKGRGLNDIFSMTIQFANNLRNGSAGGTVVKVLKNLEGNPIEGTQQLAQFVATPTAAGAMQLTGSFPYDQNGAPSTTAKTDFTANVTLKNGTMQGTFTSGTESGTVSLAQKTTSSTPNANIQGTWTGSKSNGGGVALVGNPDTAQDFAVTFGSQTTSNGLSNVSISSPVLGSQPILVSLAGVTGTTVTMGGIFPTPFTTSGLDLSGWIYTITATVTPGSPDRLVGKIAITDPTTPRGTPATTIATFTAFRQSTTATPTPTPSKNPTIFVSDRTRVVSLDDMTGKNATVNFLSGKTPYYIQDMALGPNGHLYIADYPRQLEEFDANGKFVTAYQTDSPPSHVFVDPQGRIYWRDDNVTVNRMDDMHGTNRKTLGKNDNVRFGDPAGIATDTAGYVYVADALSNRISQFDPDMTPGSMKTFGSAGSGPGQFDMQDRPGHALSIDQQNKVYVADYGNGRVVRFDADAFNHPENANVATIPMEKLRSASGLFASPLSVTVDKATPPHIYITTLEQTDRSGPVLNTYLIEVENFAIPGWDADPIFHRYGGTQAPETGQLGHFHDPEVVAVK